MTVESFPAVQLEFPPDFRASEQDVPMIGDVKVGQNIRMILNYKVIEKTRSFTILRITSAYPFPSKRTI